MNIKTQQRVDVDLSLDSEEAKKLSDFLKENLNEQSDNTLFAISNSLSNAVDGKPKKERDPNAPKPGRKPKAAQTNETPTTPAAPTAPAASAPKQPAQPTAPAQKPAQTPAAQSQAPKQKVTVGQ